MSWSRVKYGSKVGKTVSSFNDWRSMSGKLLYLTVIVAVILPKTLSDTVSIFCDENMLFAYFHMLANNTKTTLRLYGAVTNFIEVYK